MSEEAFRQIDEAANRPHHDLKSANDRPGDIPPAIETRAIAMFKSSTLGVTGHEWDWEASCEEIRNIWRLKAYRVATSHIPPSNLG